MKIRKLFSGAALAAMLAILGVTAAAHAESAVTTYNVNSSIDEPDANLNKPACKSASGKCTLRAAIMQGNKQGGKIVINVPPGIYFLLYGGIDEDQAATGDLDIRGDVTVQGVGGSPVIDGVLKDRVFDLHNNSHVQLKNLTVQDGYVQWFDIGGEATIGGGIRARGAEATLTNVQVRHNYAQDGGGIANYGVLNIYDSTLSKNHGEGGGIYNRKWNGYFAAEVRIFNSTLSGNNSSSPMAGGHEHAGTGGGIHNESGKLWVTNSTLSKNRAGWGGALANTNTGQVYLVNVTIAANDARYDGGAIFNFNAGAPHAAVVQLSNVTVVGNRANSNFEGGIGGGIVTTAGDNVTVRNSIIANNKRNVTANYVLAEDCTGAFKTGSFNLIGSNLGCTGFTNGSNGDQVGTLVVPLDPKVGALAFNGGPTKTYALLLGSTAVDRGNSDGCRNSQAAKITTDQRGHARAVNGNIGIPGTRCDIGAFEFNSP